MNQDKYNYKLDSLKSTVNKQWIFILVLVFVIFILGILVIQYDKNEKTIIMPPKHDKMFTVEGVNYSHEYYEQVTKYLASLLLTYQPENVKSRFQEVLRYVDSSYYAEMRKKLSYEAKQIKRDSATSVFHPNKATYSKDGSTITGNLIGSIGDKIVRNQEITIEFKYKITSNGIAVTSIKNIKLDTRLNKSSSSNNDEDFLGEIPEDKINLVK